MVFDSTADMIDYMALGYNSAITADRADLLFWLQASEEELGLLTDWHWREERISFTFTEGDYLFLLPEETAAVLNLYDDTGLQLRFVPGRIFDRYYRNVPSTGTPTRWSAQPRDEASQQINLRVWPTATSDLSGLMDRELRPPTLADDAGSYSRFPREARVIVCLNAMKHMANHEDRKGVADAYASDANRALEGLRLKNFERLKGRL